MGSNTAARHDATRHLTDDGLDRLAHHGVIIQFSVIQLSTSTATISLHSWRGRTNDR
jgi:hypothetical protein